MIKFIQITYHQKQFSFIDLFITCQNHTTYKIPYVVVDNEYVEQHLENSITNVIGIASYKFYRSLNNIFNDLYFDQYPDDILFNLGELQYLIYNYLIVTNLKDLDNEEIVSYICNDSGMINIDNAFYFAQHLQSIFIDYLYYRTEELIAIEDGAEPDFFPAWQIKLWIYIRKNLFGKILFTDIYRYIISDNFVGKDIMIYICNLTKIYPTHLKLIDKISRNSSIYWLYQSISDLYYGDSTPFAMQQKYISKNRSVTSLDDLYLNNINSLVANLALQSREFIELLLENNIAINILDSFSNQQQELAIENTYSSILQLLQHDISQLLQRKLSDENIVKQSVNGNYYDHIDKLGRELLSVEIHQCISPLQEIEIVADKILYMMNSNSEFQLTDFVVAAPDIQEYKAYINTVFELKCNGTKIPYDFERTSELFVQYQPALELLDSLLNIPNQLTVSIVIDFLRNDLLMKKYDLSYDHVQLLEKWLLDNNTLFGNNANDYSNLGYHNYEANSFYHLKCKLVLGCCIASKHVDYNLHNYSSYDIELEDELLDKLITIIDNMTWILDKIYQMNNEYRLLNNREVVEIIRHIEAGFLPPNPIVKTIENIFLTTYLEDINCSILRKIIAEQNPSKRMYLQGGVSCISLANLSTIKSKVIFIVGLNDKEFPRPKYENHLSVLSKIWRLSDRNNNLDDKQHFLNAILLAQDYLFMSFVVSPDNSNPSPLVNLFMNVLASSLGLIDDNYKVDFRNIIQVHSHLLENYDYQYSYYPLTIKQDLRLENFKADSISGDIKIDDLVATFLYTNNNFYKANGLQHYFQKPATITDIEFVDIKNADVSKQIYKILDKYSSQSNYDELYEYCYQQGLLNPNKDLSAIQFKNIYNDYLPPLSKNYTIDLLYSYIDEQQSLQDYHLFGDIAIYDNKIIIQSSSSRKQYPFQQLVEAITIASIVSAGAIIKDKISEIELDSRFLESVVIKHENNTVIFDVNSTKDLLLSLLDYYCYSCYNPVMVYQKTIEAGITYIYNQYSSDKDKIIKGKSDFKDFEDIFKNKKQLKSGYSNLVAQNDDHIVKEISRLYQEHVHKSDYDPTFARNLEDPIFAEFAGTYCDYVKKNNQHNSLLAIVKLFAIG